jgi:hypothetical protein
MATLGVWVLDTGTSSLKALSESASTSRVLNLSRVNARFKHEDAYLERPFFNDPNLNRAIYIKHRLRTDETYLLPRSQPVATKIIFPFDATLLKSGGRSIFVGQIGFLQAMEAFLGPSTPATRRDLDLLALLETLPSLDPFLLKEHMVRHDLRPADCYFDISVADMTRMRTFVSDQIGELITLAFGGANGGVDSEGVTRLVDALMAHDAGDRLDPLRLTLGLEGQAFHDGVFSWKGFLYYKWQFGETAKRLNRVISELDLVRFDDNPSVSAVEALSKQQTKLRKSIRAAARECTAILTLYDDAFRDLLDRGKAAAFRKFLLEAPRLFINLGSCMGTISHIESYWAYRFPESEPLAMNSVEFGYVLTEFQQSLKPDTTTEKSW